MSARTIYSTGGSMEGYPVSHWGSIPNSSGCSVAIGAGHDGRFQIAVIGPDGQGAARAGAYALVDRDELRLIHEAIGRELSRG